MVLQQFLQQHRMERKAWSQQEDLALKNLVQEIGFANWTLVAVRLSQVCQGSDRAGKQCRERWINHLDLTISKKAWSKGEEKIIFEMHNAYGNKWKDIAKHLKGRTENDIKNHFYAATRKGIRRLNKLLGFVKNSNAIRKVKPSVLSKVCEEEQQRETIPSPRSEITGVFNLIIKLSRCEPSLEQCEEVLEDQSLVKAAGVFLDRLLSQNQAYEQEKLSKKGDTRDKECSIKQFRSEEMNNEFDISEYLCMKEQLNEIQQMRAKSEGGSVRQDSIFKDDYDGYQEN